MISTEWATRNPLYPPLGRLFGRLNVLNGLGTLLVERIEDEKKRVPDGGGAYSDGRTLEMAVIVRDLTVKDGSGDPCAFASGEFSISNGSQYLGYLKELLYDATAWTVSQGYEAFETFLFDILAKDFFMRKTHDPTKLGEFERKGKNDGFAPSELGYWERYSRYVANRKPVEALKLLRREAPALRSAEKKGNFLNIDLSEWFAGLTEIRHATTHTQRELAAKTVENWTPMQRRYFEDDLALPPGARNARLQLDTGDFPLNMLAMYAYQVFKLLSIQRGFEWNLAKF